MGSANPPESSRIGVSTSGFSPSPSKPNLDSLPPASDTETALALQLLAEMYCILWRPEEAVLLRERSTEEGNPDSSARFSRYMQLGDAYSRLGQVEKSISCYESGLNVQIEALGSSHPLVADTCRYLAEAHLQAMQFDDAEIFCRKTLDIYREHSAPESLEEAADRCLLALICEARGDYNTALEQLHLARNAMAAEARDEIASIDVRIGNVYSSLGRFDEAVLSYHEALTVFKYAGKDNHTSIASIFIRLADACCKTGRFKESEYYCENAWRIYAESEVSGVLSEEIARELIEIAAIYEALNDAEAALNLLRKATKLLEGSPGHFSTVAGIEVQMGLIFNIIGRYCDAQSAFERAILKLRVCGQNKSAYFGIVLNQMGLACVQMGIINEAIDFFEEAAVVLEQECGSFHSETIGVYSNLAAAYDAAGRAEEAIELLEYIVELREGKLDVANLDLVEEKRRLAQLVREAGRGRSNSKVKSLRHILGSHLRAG